jgi:hypothetical protein
MRTLVLYFTLELKSRNTAAKSSAPPISPQEPVWALD